MTDASFWNDHYMWRGPDFKDAVWCPCDLPADHGWDGLLAEADGAVAELVAAVVDLGKTGGM